MRYRAKKERGSLQGGLIGLASPRLGAHLSIITGRFLSCGCNNLSFCLIASFCILCFISLSVNCGPRRNFVSGFFAESLKPGRCAQRILAVALSNANLLSLRTNLILAHVFLA